MGARQLNRVVRQLREVTQRQAPGEADHDLLGKFVRDRDEGAFTALVQRHGPMVLGVCRRILRNAADAEDAFQVVFLVLVRKAGTLRTPAALGSWLYGVAYRTALEARRAAARRRGKEAQAMPHTASPEALPADLLDDALAVLPEKYRAVVVLCDLEGKSYREVAQELGCAEGTVSSRLTRGRKMLAQRLARGGVTLSAGGVALALCQGAAPARVPASLVASTVKAAAGPVAAVSMSVAVLLKGVMKAMLIAKLKVVAGMFLTLALALGAGGLAYQSVDAQDTAGAQAKPKPRSELEALRRENELLKLNLEVVLEKVKAQEAELRTLRKQGAKEELSEEKIYAERLRAYYDRLRVRPDTVEDEQNLARAARAEQNAKLAAERAKKVENAAREADTVSRRLTQNMLVDRLRHPDEVKAIDDALKVLRKSGDPDAKRAADALEQAAKKLREQVK